MLNIQRNDDGTYPSHAWPGGYPIVYVMDDGEVLCPHCANDTSNPVHEGGEADGWRIDGQNIHWEGEPLYCVQCDRTIKSAYGEAEMTKPKLYTWFASSGRSLSLTLTLDDAQSCSHPGPCDADVEYLQRSISDQTDQWDAETLAAELKEYGAWDEAELSDHEANVTRMVWLACNDVAEKPEEYEVEE